MEQQLVTAAEVEAYVKEAHAAGMTVSEYAWAEALESADLLDIAPPLPRRHGHTHARPHA